MVAKITMMPWAIALKIWNDNTNSTHANTTEDNILGLYQDTWNDILKNFRFFEYYDAADTIELIDPVRNEYFYIPKICLKFYFI